MWNNKLPKNTSFTEVLHSMLLEKGCISKVAARFGKAVSTISQQLNPNCDHTHFAADNVLPAMQEAGNYEPLFWLASKCGFMCVPTIEPKESKCAFDLLINKSGKEFSDVVYTFHKIIEDGVIDNEESDLFDKEVDEAIQSLAFMKEVVRSVAGTGTLPKEIMLSRIAADGTDRQQ